MFNYVSPFFSKKILQNFKIEYHHEKMGAKARLVNIPDQPLRFKFIDLKWGMKLLYNTFLYFVYCCCASQYIEIPVQCKAWIMVTNNDMEAIKAKHISSYKSNDSKRKESKKDMQMVIRFLLLNSENK